MKIIAKILTVFCVALVLFQSVALGSDQQVKLRIMLREVDKWFEIDKDTVKEFENMHPHIQVEIERNPTDADAVTVQYAAGVGPDVMIYWGQVMRSWIERGLFADLAPFIEKYDVHLDDFFPVSLETMTVDGILYALPWDTGTCALYVNKTRFEEVGASIPSGIWKHTELITLGKKLNNDEDGDGNVDRRAYGVGPDQRYINMWVRRFGGDLHLPGDPGICTWDSEEAGKALEFLYQLRHEYQILGSWGFGSAWTYMEENGSWSLGGYGAVELPFDIDIAHPPAGPAGPVTRHSTNGVAVSSSTRYPEEAFMLAMSLVSREAMILRFAGGLQPPRFSLAGDWIDYMETQYPMLKDVNLNVFYEVAEYTMADAFLAEQGKAGPMIKDFINRVLVEGEGPVAAKVVDLVRRINAIGRK